MVKKRKVSRPKLLSHTRPASINKPTSPSSRASRSLIRNHHILQKQLHSARGRNDTAEITSLEARVGSLGGLVRYQEASIQGQSLQRGGDSSKVLIHWLSEIVSASAKNGFKYRMLEVGALRADNACARGGIMEVTRIDLHSQHPDIQSQDFMERPIPPPSMLEAEAFDIVSLSLVINYTGDAVGRGNMLKRVSSFLRQVPARFDETASDLLPALFLVLPAPCVTNSRYLDENRLSDMMCSLGYKKVKRKMSAKLVYYLWKYEGKSKKARKVYRKEELRSGKSRNNFAIAII